MKHTPVGEGTSARNQSEAGNLNYHSVSGGTVFDDRMVSPEFLHYRKQWRENPAKGIVSGFPLHLDIESTNACNLRCAHCASTSDNWGSGEKGMMSLSLYEKILNEAVEGGICCMKFSLRGEPLLHPHIVDMIRMAHEQGVLDLYFNTNGMLLTEEISDKLIDAGLPRLSVSVDGWDKSSFEANRSGANYDIVCHNIDALLQKRIVRGVTYPKIRIQAVMLDRVREHWEEYQARWRGVADEIGYLDARQEGSGIDHRGICCAEFSCPFLWQRMTVLWDGTLLPCLAHGVKDISSLVLGDANVDSISELWHSMTEESLRMLHRAGNSHLNDGCNACSYRAMEVRKLLNSR